MISEIVINAIRNVRYPHDHNSSILLTRGLGPALRLLDMHNGHSRPAQGFYIYYKKMWRIEIPLSFGVRGLKHPKVLSETTELFIYFLNHYFLVQTKIYVRLFQILYN